MKKHKERLHQIIFGVDTTAGKIFDHVLLILILASIVVLMLESVVEVSNKWGWLLRNLEWIITGLFTFLFYLDNKLSKLEKELKAK